MPIDVHAFIVDGKFDLTSARLVNIRRNIDIAQAVLDEIDRDAVAVYDVSYIEASVSDINEMLCDLVLNLSEMPMVDADGASGEFDREDATLDVAEPLAYAPVIDVDVEDDVDETDALVETADDGDVAEDIDNVDDSETLLEDEDEDEDETDIEYLGIAAVYRPNVDDRDIMRAVDADDEQMPECPIPEDAQIAIEAADETIDDADIDEGAIEPSDGSQTAETASDVDARVEAISREYSDYIDEMQSADSVMDFTPNDCL